MTPRAISEMIVIDNDPFVEAFWEEKKSTYVRIKEWEDERGNF